MRNIRTGKVTYIAKTRGNVFGFCDGAALCCADRTYNCNIGDSAIICLEDKSLIFGSIEAGCCQGIYNIIYHDEIVMRDIVIIWVDTIIAMFPIYEWERLETEKTDDYYRLVAPHPPKVIHISKDGRATLTEQTAGA